MTEIVHVPLGDRAYDIHIGGGLIARAGGFVAPLSNGRKVAIVTDETVADLHLDVLQAGLATGGVASAALALPAGEATKGWAGLQRTVEWLIGERLERGDLVIAFGGGVIGDLAGFAAAILRRGVRYLQIPTTLLAQVDSSVGGKTAINSPQGKNLVGAFHQPAMVLADTDLLRTLDGREFLAGYGEVVKYGLLGDADFFAWLEGAGPALAAGDEGARIQAIRRSCEMKARIVAADEREAGERALLNLGHTFAHVLETATGYSERLKHGEAVAIGLGLAFDLSQRLGLCAQEHPGRVRAHLRQMGMMAEVRDIPGDLPPTDDLVAMMAQDKKVRDGRLRFILARDIGETFVADDVPIEQVGAVIADSRA